MSEAATSARQPAAEQLSVEDITKILRSLKPGEKTALTKIARAYAGRTPYDHQDLLQEAICRVLDGKRAWRTDLAPTAFLAGVMRSIAWEWKSDILDPESDVGDEGTEARGVISRIEAQDVIALFSDDPIAQKMIVGMMEGARGEELQASCGLSQTEYESKRKKIRRRIEKLSL